MLKIVYVVESLEISGGVKVIVEHADGLLARGHDVSIVTRDPRHDWIRIETPILSVPAFDAGTLPRADVHVATWFPTVVPTVRAAQAERIFHFSQGYEAIYPYLAPRREEIDEAYSQPVPKLLISAHLETLFRGRFPGPFHVLPQAIRVADYRPTEPRSAPRPTPAIGVVGPFEAVNKGIPVALAALRRLRRQRPLRIHRASQLPLSAEEAGRWPSESYRQGASVEEMISFYKTLDLLIHPSFEAEGFPLPPLEAMASGVPVVVTDIPSYGPIPDDSVSRVAPGDEEAMAREAERLLGDPPLWAARRARGLEVAAGFDLPRVLDVLESVLVQKTS